MRIDLHSHTDRSDGVLSPAALLDRAAGAGVTHLSVTDHDTVAGLAEAARAARERGVTLVPGIEISATLHGREIHLLGHGIVPTEPALEAFCVRMTGERADRIRRMVERLAACGVSVPIEEVEAEARGESIGRPHLARVLVRQGLVGDLSEAFRRYLAPHKPGWVERFRPEAAEAIAIIHAAGGTATVAHPGSNGVSREELARLASFGLDGVEAHHRDHPPSQVQAYERWGNELGLFATGGSDFHGPGGGVPCEPGTPSTPPASWARLEALGAARRGRVGLRSALDRWTAMVDGS